MAQPLANLSSSRMHTPEDFKDTFQRLNLKTQFLVTTYYFARGTNCNSNQLQDTMGNSFCDRAPVPVLLLPD